jgi:hypothetical protein
MLHGRGRKRCASSSSTASLPGAAQTRSGVICVHLMSSISTTVATSCSLTAGKLIVNQTSPMVASLSPGTISTRTALLVWNAPNPPTRRTRTVVRLRQQRSPSSCPHLSADRESRLGKFDAYSVLFSEGLGYTMSSSPADRGLKMADGRTTGAAGRMPQSEFFMCEKTNGGGVARLPLQPAPVTQWQAV